MISKEEQQFLEQGIINYVDAMSAISAFQALIQRTCRQAVEKKLSRYAKALGVQLSKGELLEDQWSKGREHSLGVKFVNRDYDAHFDHAFYWGPTESGQLETGILVGVWSKAKRVARLGDELRRRRIEYEPSEARGIFLADDVVASDVGQMESKLDALMERWIDLWSKAGGLKVLAGDDE